MEWGCYASWSVSGAWAQESGLSRERPGSFRKRRQSYVIRLRPQVSVGAVITLNDYSMGSAERGWVDVHTY